MTKNWDTTKLLALRDRIEAWLLKQPGVYGTAVGKDHDGRLSLKIFVEINAMIEKEMIKIAERIGDAPISFVETEPLVEDGH